MPNSMRSTAFSAFCCLAVLWSMPAEAATLEVGPGKTYARVDLANAAAKPGDTILVYPPANDASYEGTAVLVRTARLSFRAVPQAGQSHVRLSGRGFDYSGSGRIPRAIFQFDPAADDCSLEGFELTGAHNASHNGAGVRINQANRVVLRKCDIHHNDMGIMSGGDGTLNRGVAQYIISCHIHHNGDPTDPGFNHNLYLGGTSVCLRFCEVDHSLTGHNVKSRAHHTRLEYCYVHDSANRECDFVDAADTAQPESHAVVLGCIVVKDRAALGNRTVFHFGQDGGKDHDGTLFLAFNTIITPFLSPIVELSAPQAATQWTGNLVSDGGQRQPKQHAYALRNGASVDRVGGKRNWLSGGYAPCPGLPADVNRFERSGEPLFLDLAAQDYRLTDAAKTKAKLPAESVAIALPALPGAAASFDPPLVWQYRHPLDGQRRTGAAGLIGACGP